jgi:hypothetical protein
MKQDYFGFNGDKLIYLGEFEDIDEAFIQDEKMEAGSFFVGDREHWLKILPKMLDTVDK